MKTIKYTHKCVALVLGAAFIFAACSSAPVYQRDERVLLYPEAGKKSPALSFSVRLLDSADENLQPLLRSVLYDGKNCADYTESLFITAKNKYIDSKPPAAPADVEDAKSMNWTYSEESADAVYNNVIVIERVRDIYEGGAHPMHEKEFIVLDTKQAKQVRLTELVTKDGLAALKAQLEARLRTQYAEQSGTGTALSKNATLTDIGFFDNSITVPEQNFFVKPSGLVFVWNPYAIAPYSFGIIEVELRYAEIKNLLTAEGEALFQSMR
ncbi:MAG: RsiV family protein [Spirochaetaceae bacterium]|jgi:hypothetical protein|nr:RsiV family protein [Spirochaetaceae bacterium]